MTRDFLLAVLVVFVLPYGVVGLPICTNEEAPALLKAGLKFCSDFVLNDSSCCNSTVDGQLEATFVAFNISSAACAAYVKEILCATCDPYAGELFQVVLGQKRSVPVLCTSNQTAASNATTNAYCTDIWDTCKDVAIVHSPFQSSLVALQSATKLTDLWESEKDFCNEFGGPSGSGDFCYSGTKFTPFQGGSIPLPELEGICFEKIGDGVYLNMIPHPDGTNRVFVASQSGKIWLATVPLEGSQQPLILNESAPFLDISGRVVSTGEYGLLGLAFHPNYTKNGRFFVSYNCEKTVWPDCAGLCACNANTGCTLSELGPEAGTIPCQFSSVIAEYSANSSSTASSAEATAADPNEVRRIFTMGLPYSTHHGGQLLFGPRDSYLYFMMGDGGSSGDPFNFAQNKKSLLGKIMRFDVDAIPSATYISTLSLWGNYSIPPDNPFIQDNNSRPEIWAYGLRNPWRCSFDKIDPGYFYCADVGQVFEEEVDLITRGGNYGWRVYDGTAVYTPSRSPGGNTSVNSIQPIFPILEYSHNAINPSVNAASITGGFVSRSSQDACLYGRYVYADLYGQAMWAAAETPLGSGNYTTSRVKFVCSANSTLDCKGSANSSEPGFLYVFSYGEDNTNNLYVLSASGVYKVVSPSGCGFSCNATLPAGAIIPVVTVPPSSVGASPAPAPSTQPSAAYKLLLNSRIWVAMAVMGILKSLL